MKNAYKIKEMLCEKLDAYGEGEIRGAQIEEVDTLAHAIKNLCKIIKADEEEYSNRSYRGSSYDDGSYRRRSYDDGVSYEGGSYDGGYSRRRDSMGRYSRHGFADKLRELMQEAPDEMTKIEIRRLAEKAKEN